MGVISKKLAQLDETSTDEALGLDIAWDLYKVLGGQTVEIYLGEKSGSLYYSDFDVEQKVYVTGKVIGALGKLLLLECTVETPSRNFTKEVLINCWSITGVMVKSEEGHDHVHISHIFQEMKR